MQKVEKTYQVLKQFKQFQWNVIYQIFNINKSLKYYTVLLQIDSFCAYLLNVEPSNAVFLKTQNTEFGEVIITFTDKNGRPLETEDKNYMLFELSNAMIFYRTKNKKIC